MATKEEKISITKYDLLYEQRMTKVETVLENMVKTMDGIDKNMRDGFREMRTDFRWIVLIMLGGFGTLFTMMVRGFHWFN